MSSILMAGCYDFFLIKWIANILGLVMSGLYNFFALFDYESIGACIILFTVICKLLLFPITVKQQKFSKVSSVMNPELQAIQKKYKGKRDNESMMKMQAETQALYKKYGTSPTGSCLPLLLQMLILLALYAVIISIPTYVKPVSNIYNNISTEMVSVMGDLNNVHNVDEIVNGDNLDTNLSTLIDNNYDSSLNESENNKKIYDNLINLYATIKPLDELKAIYTVTKDDNGNITDVSVEVIDKLMAIEDSKWDEFIKAEEVKENKSDYKIDILTKFKNFDDAAWIEYEKSIVNSYYLIYEDNDENTMSYSERISDIYTWCGLDLSKSPSELAWFAMLIPILSFLTQWISMKITTSNQPNMADNPMGSSLKVMNFTMPLISAFFCYTLPTGLGLYWVMAAVVQIGQQLIINAHFKKVDVNDIIAENIEKANKKKARMGVAVEQKTITNAANFNTKNIKYDSSNDENIIDAENYTIEGEEDNTTKTKSKGSIASRANMVKEFNERNK